MIATAIRSSIAVDDDGFGLTLFAAHGASPTCSGPLYTVFLSLTGIASGPL